MKVVDKVLLAMMVLLLPLGVFASYKMFPQGDVLAEQDKKLAQIDNLINQLNQKTAGVNGTANVPITLTRVTYASASGTLRVEGTAPGKKSSVLVSAMVLPPAPAPAELGGGTDSRVYGTKVDTVSVPTEGNGTFAFEYDVTELTQGIVEVRFEQDSLVKTVRFDLKTKKQVF